MWIAKTSFTDGIAVVIFVTVLFFLLLGAVIFVRWIFRLISGRSEPESVVLVFPNTYLDDEDEKEVEDSESLENFAWFLHTKLRGNQLGHFADVSYESEEILLIFKGGDANQIWQLIHTEAKDKVPKIPLRVILERSKKHGGQRIIEPIAWQATSTCFPRPNLPTIPEALIRLSRYGKTFTIMGIGGLCSWGILRKHLKLTENEFRDTVFGNYSAWIIGILLIVGLSLKWFSYAKVRSFAKLAGFPPGESSTSTILKYVLLLVILIFGLVLVLVV